VSAVVGVDVGGTKIAAACLRDRTLGDSVMISTDVSSADQIIEQIVSVVDDCRPDGLEGVGLGLPSVVDFATGTIVSSANIPLADVPLREVLSDRLGVPVFVDNDATVAALAEAHDDSMTMVARDLVMITIGTGIGGGLVLGGRIYRGATGGAGELGHTIVAMDPIGPVPSGEGVAAGHALDTLARTFAHEHPGSALGRHVAEGEPASAVELVRSAEEGDAEARRVVELWGERVGIGIANAINTFDPEEVVIGGGAARSGELLLAPARRTAAAYVLPGLGRATTIRAARHGVRAGVLGAALLAVHELADAVPPSPTESAGVAGAAGAAGVAGAAGAAHSPSGRSR
jgi:glucokinase